MVLPRACRVASTHLVATATKTASVPGLNLTVTAQTDADAQHFAQRLAAANFCQETGLCKGNLGLARIEMPVVKGKHLWDFVKRLKAGLLNVPAAMARGFKATRDWLEGTGRPVSYKVKNFDPTKLKATQREINADKARMIMEKHLNGTFDHRDEEILVSADGYILDGHHRWAGQVLLKAEHGITIPLKGVQVGLNVRELLAVANAYTDAAGLARRPF